MSSVQIRLENPKGNLKNDIYVCIQQARDGKLQAKLLEKQPENSQNIQITTKSPTRVTIKLLL